MTHGGRGEKFSGTDDATDGQGAWHGLCCESRSCAWELGMAYAVRAGPVPVSGMARAVTQL